MTADPYTDRTVLTTEAYADPGRLSARYSLYAHREPPLDLAALATGLLHDVPGPVLDIGCGPGRYVAALRPHRTVIAADLSFGMARVAGRPALVADVAALPFADDSCGAVLAMHMLYHAPDPEAGIRELARVVAPGGTVLVATNHAEDKARLYALCAAAAEDVPGAPAWDRDVNRRFGLDAAHALAERHFAAVERIDLPGDVVLTDPEPAVAFAASTRSWQPGDAFSRVLDRIRERVAEVIAAEQAFRFGTHPGILVCR
jgi:SAM-dependent methyltransferase